MTAHILAFPCRDVAGVIHYLSPAVAAAFRGIEAQGLNGKTARALADTPAATPQDFAALLSALVEAMDEPPWGFGDTLAETLWKRAFEYQSLPDSFGFNLGLLTTLAESRAQVCPARYKHTLPLVKAVDRDFEVLAGELFEGGGHEG